MTAGIPVTGPSSRIDRASRLSPGVLRSLREGRLDAAGRLAACRRLLEFGHIGAAIRHLAPLLDDAGLRPQAEALLGACRALRGLDVGAAPVATEDRAGAEDGVWVVPASSETTVVVFTGRAKRAGVSVYFMQRLIAAHGFNAVHLFDWQDVYYLGGVSGLAGVSGLGGFEATLAALDRLCRDLGTRRLICLGQSAGGHAALHYGLRLAADGVVAFSPIIGKVVQPSVLERIVATTGRRWDTAALDLGAHYAAAARRPRTLVVHGADNRADSESAATLAGIDGVTLQPLAGVRAHGVIQHLTVTGAFAALVRDFCAGVAPGYGSAAAGEP